MTILWSFTNFFQYQFSSAALTLLAIRIDLFVAVWHAFFFFRFSYVFPRGSLTFPRWYNFALVPVVTVVSALTLTPFVASGISQLAPRGEVTTISQGPGIAAFVLVTIGLLLAGFIALFRLYRYSSDGEQVQVHSVMVGMGVTGFMVIFFSMLLPLFFHRLTFLPYSAAFMLPFIGLISYSIYREHLFGFKVLTVQSFAYILGLLMFIEVILTREPILVVFRIALLVAVVIAGVLFARSVTKEIEQRELIEKQEKELERINVSQENLLHFMSHEIKGYLTKSEAAFASIVEGDFGHCDPELEKLSNDALTEVRKGVDTIMDILDAASLKKGTMSLKKDSFDFREALDQVIGEQRHAAADKNLALNISADPGQYPVLGDKEKLCRHVIRNLIDNAIKYTPEGSIEVSLARVGTALRLSVKDSGVGITPEDMAHLFTEGGRGKDSIKINVHSTGFGLYIAKQIVTAHQGRIWAESAGQGRGTVFIVELPLQP
jgi:signal transduction histidine kinase